MIVCDFELNSRPMSTFEMLGQRYPAFSGYEEERNKISAQCTVDRGPIPLGTYYVVDRKSGGLLGGVRDYFYDKKDWLALYAAVVCTK